MDKKDGNDILNRQPVETRQTWVEFGFKDVVNYRLEQSTMNELRWHAFIQKILQILGENWQNNACGTTHLYKDLMWAGETVSNIVKVYVHMLWKCKWNQDKGLTQILESSYLQME